LFLIEDKGLYCRQVSMPFRALEQRPEPICRHFYVAVEQHVIVGTYLAQRFVIASGITVVLFETDQVHLGILCRYPIRAAIVAAIIGHNNVKVIVVCCQYTGQEFLQLPAGIVIQDDDGNGWAHTLASESAGA